MSYDRSESFDVYNATIANMAGVNGWNGTNGTVVIASGGTGFEGNALKCAHSTSQAADNAGSLSGWYRLTATTSSRSEYWIMASFKTEALPNAAGYYTIFLTDVNTSGTFATGLTAIMLASDGSISARSLGGGSLGSSSGGYISANTRHHLAIRIKAHASAGEVEVWVDGTQALSLTSKNTTSAAASVNINSFIFNSGRSASTSNNTWWDDIIIVYVDGTAPNTRIADTQLRVRRTVSDVSITNWTPSTGSTAYDLVDDNPMTGGTDYVSSSTVGAVLSMGSDTIGGAESVRAVVMKGILSKDDAGARTARMRIADNSANVANGTTRSPPAATQTLYTDYFGTTPAGGGWDAATVNVLRQQVEVVA